ncbi:uncharacterized protein LOC105020751 [Esox lucius]|uniref:uncharacterized protein LOC105020751 n=1 Tax=Esox lucius TaxID=8010 RepID=UPI0014777E58|nr:uncharacterized protein LOC105020751 [Esox lucius]
MKYLLVCLLLSSLWSISSWGITNTGLVVIQSPHYVTVTEGETVHIQCCWNKNLTRVTVNWKSNAANTSELVNKSQCQKSASEQNVSCCSNLTISNLNRNDSGTYTCKVSSEIPVLQQSVGNGTHLTVTSKNDGISGDLHNNLHWSIIALLVLLPPPLLLALLYLYRVKRKQGGASAKMVRVIHQTPDYEDDELKTEDLRETADQTSDSSSRGSTQWCQVQVYESLDYLALPTKDNG